MVGEVLPVSRRHLEEQNRRSIGALDYAGLAGRDGQDADSAPAGLHAEPWRRAWRSICRLTIRPQSKSASDPAPIVGVTWFQLMFRVRPPASRYICVAFVVLVAAFGRWLQFGANSAPKAITRMAQTVGAAQIPEGSDPIPQCHQAQEGSVPAWRGLAQVEELQHHWPSWFRSCEQSSSSIRRMSRPS